MSEQKSGIVFKVLTGVFAVAAIIALYLFLNTKTELADLQEEKEAQRIEFQEDLDNLMTKHNQLKTENGELTETLAEKDLEIQAKAQEIEEALKFKWSYYSVKKKFEELQKVSDGYLIQINELKEANQELTAENAEVKSKFAAEQKKTTELSKIKANLTSKVNEASELKTFEVFAYGVKIRGNGKEVITDKARRINNIKVTFGIAKNALAKAGPRDFYIRIAQPNSKILAKGEGDDFAFNFNGEKLQYSIMTTADYTNDNLLVNCYYTLADKQRLADGEYKVEVYEGNDVIGHANFVVR